MTAKRPKGIRRSPAGGDIVAVGELPAGYGELLEGLKERIARARIRASLAANRELVLLYLEIGQRILERQRAEGWGARVIDRLADDLRRAFPDVKGFSPRNLKYMRALSEAYSEDPIVQQVAAQLPWFHLCTLLDRVKDGAEREWYMRACVEHGWSRNMLVHQIETRLFQRQGRAVVNFERTLPPPQSDLAAQILKDPYVFDFLGLGDEAVERELHRGLMQHLRDFLIELGVGFAFVGSEYHLEVGESDFYIDLLFYHLRLRCFVVVELKTGPFKPEYAGKLNFYLSAVDDLVRHDADQPSIGLLLCKSKDRVLVEYALRDLNKPIGVAEWETRLVESLPDELKGSLPTVEDLERELGSGSQDTGAAAH